MLPGDPTLEEELPDNTQLNEAEKRIVDRLFVLLDVDSSGSLYTQEVLQSLKGELGTNNEANPNAMLDLLDEETNWPEPNLAWYPTADTTVTVTESIAEAGLVVATLTPSCAKPKSGRHPLLLSLTAASASGPSPNVTLTLPHLTRTTMGT